MAKKREVKIPWDKEEEGSGRTKFKEADYAVKITKANYVRSKEKDTPGIEVEFKITEGRYKGKKITENLWIQPKSLRRLRWLCEAVGIKAPKKPSKLDLDKLVGKKLGITIEDDEYKIKSGKNKGRKVKGSTVAFEGFMSIDDLESGGVDEEDEDTDDTSNDASDDSDASQDSEDTDSDEDSDDTDSDVSIDSDSL